ncbi:MAG TPA: SGNH hydrolase domain-containing protein [Acidimicrobiia bacterium]
MLTAVGLVVMIVAFGLGGPVGGPSRGGRTRRSSAGDASSRPRLTEIAFRQRLPVLKAILEPPAGVVPAVAPAALAARPAVIAKPAVRIVPLVRAGVGNRPLRILVVGDSVGVSFARGLELWAGQRGNVRVLDDARYWCALGRNGLIVQGLTASTPSTGCTDWGTRWAAAIRTFDPDVTIVLFSIWEIALRRLPGRGDWLLPGAPALDDWQLSEYQAAADVLSARGAPVVWFTIPCENTPIRPGDPLWFVDRHTIPRLAASRPAVHVVDLDHELCAHGASHAFAGIADARPDGAHFSDAGALAVARWVMPIVLGAAPNPVSIAERDPAPDAGITRRAS